MNDHPHPLPRLDLSGFVHGVWNPEDLLDLPGSPWIVVSAMRSRHRPGGLRAVRRDRPERAIDLPWSRGAEAARRSADVFDPHGIAARPLDGAAVELLVIDHGGDEAVCRLRIEPHDERPSIVGGERIAKPPGTSGNALAPLPDGGFVLTSMFDPDDADVLAKFAGGRTTGGVWRWRPDGGWSRFGPLALSGANGIAAAPDGSAVYVSEWSARRLWRLGPDGEPAARADIRFLPDNLRWRPDGTLLLAGQAARPEIVFGCEARGGVCPLAFEVASVDPETLAVTSLLAADEAQAASWAFGGATGALDVGEELWVGSFTGERIARFRPRAGQGSATIGTRRLQLGS